MLTKEQKEIIIEQVAKTFALAKNLGYPSNPVTVTFTEKGKVAGAWYPAKKQVSFNPILAFENFEVFYSTVVHEVAHALDHFSGIDKMPNTVRRHKNGNRDMHGRYFKAIMRKLGHTPSTYHDYKVKTTRNWNYKCNNCAKDWKLSTVMHNRIQKGEVRICTCKSKLTRENYELSNNIRK